MQELAPQMALQQVAQPLHDPLRQRQGIATLQRILWNNGQPVWEFPSLHMDRSTYLQEACSHMSATEQVKHLACLGQCRIQAAASRLDDGHNLRMIIFANILTEVCRFCLQML